ncbi:MAG: hypothetical protein IV090_11585 [Candidatus Sericytochromatia bacterium]|nr:hypothetical protein [Candidatus Sericytochromatia bacterium]
MSKPYARLVLVSLFSFSVLSNVACGRRLPNQDKPPGTEEPGAPAEPGTPPAPPAPPTDPVLPPAPPAPPTDPGTPPAPPAPPTDPGTPPAPPAPPTNPGNPPAPPTDPGAPPAPPSNPAIDAFFAEMAKAGFSDAALVKAELQKTVSLKVTGWSKGKAETPDLNVEAMFNATKALFKTPPANPKEYFERSMAFAQQPGNCTFFVDLKVSAERKDLYVMKFDPASKQILGINEKDLDYVVPEISAMSARNTVLRRLNAVEGKVFFYGEEQGKFLDPARFIPVPAEVLNPQLMANRVRTSNVGTYRVMPTIRR